MKYVRILAVLLGWSAFCALAGALGLAIRGRAGLVFAVPAAALAVSWHVMRAILDGKIR